MNWDQVAVALIAAVPSFLLGYLAYKRSRHVDAVSEQSGIASDSRAGVAQIIEGLNGLIDNLQEDNQFFRDDIKRCVSRLDSMTTKHDELKRELTRMRRRYGDNDDTIEGGTK